MYLDPKTMVSRRFPLFFLQITSANTCISKHILYCLSCLLMKQPLPPRALTEQCSLMVDGSMAFYSLVLDIQMLSQSDPNKLAGVGMTESCRNTAKSHCC